MEGTKFIRSRFVIILDLFQIILQIMFEIIDSNIKIYALKGQVAERDWKNISFL